MITADHGCDPSYTKTTDHTREYVPLIVAGPRVKPVNLGTRATYADIAATAAELLGVQLDTPGRSFAGGLCKPFPTPSRGVKPPLWRQTHRAGNRRWADLSRR